LKELRLAHNALKALPPELGTSCEWLRVLDASHNRFEDWGDVACLKRMTRLQQLSLRGCPLSRREGYDAAAVKMCPSLRALDGRKVGPGGWIEKEAPREEEEEEEETARTTTTTTRPSSAARASGSSRARDRGTSPRCTRRG
jgi:hypothetical protein